MQVAIRRMPVRIDDTSPRTRAALDGGLHALMAAILAIALGLAALPPSGWEDPWLRIGTISLVLALASWLPAVALLPSTAAVWLLPMVLHGALNSISTGVQPFAELLALVFIALGWSVVYREFFVGPGKQPKFFKRDVRLQSEQAPSASDGAGVRSPGEMRGHSPAMEKRQPPPDLPRFTQLEASLFLWNLRCVRGELEKTRLSLAGARPRGPAASERT